MSYRSDIAFTDAVKAEQHKHGSRDTYERMMQKADWNQKITPELAQFIAERDSFYLATANGEGQPYIQHRGGPKGFLRLVNETTLGFADFTGNRQYISLGNLKENNKVSLFFMDYANRRRIKLWGTAEAVETDPELARSLHVQGYRAAVERAILIHVAAWDVNCPAHITPRFDEEQVVTLTEGLRSRIRELEAELETLKSQA